MSAAWPISMGVAVAAALCAAALAADPAPTKPASMDETLWRRLTEIDGRVAKIEDLRGDFTQEKFTPLLKKPLVSRGRVVIKGSRMRWDTAEPRISVMLLSATEITFYYPADKAAEVYPLDQRAGELAASPLPRLGLLLKYFDVGLNSAAGGGVTGDMLALRLKPLAGELKEHVDHVDVVVDVRRGYLTRMEMVDGQGERTTVSFTHVQLNTHVTEDAVSLKLPEGTRVSRPLEAAR